MSWAGFVSPCFFNLLRNRGKEKCPSQIVEGEKKEKKQWEAAFNLTACVRRGECGPATSLQKWENYLLGYVLDNAHQTRWEHNPDIKVNASLLISQQDRGASKKCYGECRNWVFDALTLLLCWWFAFSQMLKIILLILFFLSGTTRKVASSA